MSNKLKLNCAVIGAGNMGKNHARTYSEIPSINLVAIVDVNEKLGNEVARTYGSRYYNDLSEMLSKENIQVVSICVPTALHVEVAKKCIDKRVNVLLEKPIAMNVKEGEEILKYAKKKNVKMMVGHIERFNPAVQHVKQMIKKKELGDVIAIMARRVGGFPPQIRDANIAVDLAIHDIDIVNYLLEALPEEVSFHKGRNHIKKREDSVEFFLKYKNASAYLQANWVTPVKIRKLNITGTKGYLEMDYINQKIEFYKSNYKKFRETSKNFSDYILRFSEPDVIGIAVAKKEPLKEEILYFIDCVNKNKKIDCQFAVDALKIATS